MGHSNGIITTPVGLDTDIPQTLGVSSKDLGTLCTSTAINKWSRKKPIRIVGLWGDATDAQFKASGFGLQLPSGSSDAITASNGSYTYLKPRGSANNEPYRISDFINYNHYALPPCQGAGDYNVNTLLGSVYTFAFPMAISGGLYDIGLSEINPDLINCYAAIVIQYQSNNTTLKYYRTTAKKIGEFGGIGITFNLKTDPPFVYTNILRAQYWWVAARAAKPDFNSQEPAGQMYYALPFGKASDATGNINITRSTNVAWTAVGLCNTATGTMKNIQLYESRPIEIGQMQVYFSIGRNGGLYVEFQLKNSNAAPAQLNLSSGNITGEFMPSFANVSNPNTTGKVGLIAYRKMDNGSYEKISSIVNIPANTTWNVRFGHDQWLGYYNGSAYVVAPNQQKSQCAGTIYYSGTRVSVTRPINLET